VGFLGEAGLIQFRAEFDVLNHPNPNRDNGSARLGAGAGGRFLDWKSEPKEKQSGWHADPDGESRHQLTG